MSYMFTQWPYLWYLSVELRHIISQQSAKFSKSLLMPRIIFQWHFALYFCVINHNWAELTTSVRRIERCTCLPVILQALSAIHPCDAIRIPRRLSLYTRHTMHCLLLVAVITTAVKQCANRSRPSIGTMLTYLGKQKKEHPVGYEVWYCVHNMAIPNVGVWNFITSLKGTYCHHLQRLKGTDQSLAKLQYTVTWLHMLKPRTSQPDVNSTSRDCYRHFRFKSRNGPAIQVQTLNKLHVDRLFWL